MCTAWRKPTRPSRITGGEVAMLRRGDCVRYRAAGEAVKEGARKRALAG